MTTAPIPPCPNCGAERTVGILYGFPTGETMEAAERGEIPWVAIGGCCVDEDNPMWACPECRHRWSDPSERAGHPDGTSPTMPQP